MIELIYPVDDMAPVLPMVSAGTTESAANGGDVEMFPIIDEEGLVIGRAERSYCHGGSRLLHPVVHLHLIDRQERIYLQKRSMKKKLLPGKWDTAVGGHIMYGEAITEALYREAREELGLDAFNPIFIKSYRWDTAVDAEFVNVFAAVGNLNPVPDMDEVEQGRWWSIPEIEKKLETGVFTPNFVDEFRDIRDSLLSLL